MKRLYIVISVVMVMGMVLCLRNTYSTDHYPNPACSSNPGGQGNLGG